MSFVPFVVKLLSISILPVVSLVPLGELVQVGENGQARKETR